MPSGNVNSEEAPPDIRKITKSSFCNFAKKSSVLIAALTLLAFGIG